MRQLLIRSLNIQPGEGAPIALLSGYSFLGGICLAYIISLGNAFFLVEFGTEYLPHGYIVTGVVGYLAGAFLTALQRRLSFSRLLLAILCLLFAVTCAYRIGFWIAPSRWLALGMFASIGPYIMLVYFVFRSLVGRLFDLRQGKRLYGLISTGEVISTMLGFFSVPLLLRLLPDSTDLLLIAAVALLLCIWVLFTITRKFEAQISTPPGQKKAEAKSGFSELMKRRYFALLFTLSVASVFGFYYIDYTFLGQLRVRFPDKSQVAQFIGVFYGIIRIIEFVFKTFLSGRLMSQYGLKLGLVSLPFLLCVCTSIAAFSHAVFTDVGTLLFLLIAFNKLIERVVTKALYDPAFNILYQPLDADLRLAVQTKVDGTIQQLAVFVVGATLLLFSWAGSFYLVVDVLAFILAGWAVASVFMYREYRQTLLQNLASQTSQASTPPSAEMLSLHSLNEGLKNPDANCAILAMDFLERVEPASFEAYLAGLLTHPADEVRRVALGRAGRLGCLSLADDVQQRIEAERTHEGRQAAADALAALSSAAEIAADADRLAALAQSGQPGDRLLSACLLGQLGGNASVDLLSGLLQDDHPGVRRAALVAAGRAKHPRFWQTLIDHLSFPAFCDTAASVLCMLGEPVLLALEAAFARPGQASQTMMRIVKIYGRIGGAQAGALLIDKINFPDRAVRDQTLASLRLIKYQVENGASSVVRQEIERSVGNAVWGMASLLDIGEGKLATALQSALGHDLDSSRERIFQLLALIYEAQSIQLVMDSFKSGSNNGKVYALELIDVFVAQDLKEILFPILDDLTLGQRLKRLEMPFPQQRLGLVQRLKDIVNRDYLEVGRWTKACALQALPEACGDRVEDELVANLFHPDALLRETAAWGICRIDPETYDLCLERLQKQDREALRASVSRVERDGREAGRLRLTIEKVLILKSVALFARIPEMILAEMAPSWREVTVRAGAPVVMAEDGQNWVYVVVEGEVMVCDGDTRLSRLGGKDVLGEITFPRSLFDALSATVVGQARLLRMDLDVLSTFVSDRVEVASSIIRATRAPSLLADMSRIGDL